MFHPQTSLNNFLEDLPTYLPNQESNEQDKVNNQSQNQSSHSIPFESKVKDNDEFQTKQKPEEKLAKFYKPVKIPGTNITLQTEEDIAKWIEERKKNWPSKSNIEKKEQIKAEKRKKYQDNTTSIGQTKRKLEESNQNESSNSNKRSRNICRHFQQFKKCKFGTKCKNLHEIPNDPNPIASNFKNDLTHTKRKLNGITILVPKLYSNRTENTPTSKSSLFKHLITQDQAQNENQLVLDFIKYLDEKGLINHDVMK
ncbi:uncharacterized protein KGF55_005245 [Candida pseudojiufengensis]|uniref:uncharacterized protein n=1 Tax=Candida pseudojiufengensis TaxID=497109 RepID=UPI0022253AEE|nr:uncharacterized protein KGF55_005245 [Candida pseudojiufengensis]KAI5959601.1 hypothetical protein KGF55_005245 [Candida pseudojiufengensis]